MPAWVAVCSACLRITHSECDCVPASCQRNCGMRVRACEQIDHAHVCCFGAMGISFIHRHVHV